MDRKLTFILVLGLVITSALYAYSPQITILQADQLQQTIQLEPNKISASGRAEIKVMPDLAYVHAGVVTKGASAQAAEEDNKKQMNSVLAKLRAEGISGKDVQTMSFSIHPQYDWSNGKRINRGYQASHMLKITVKDTDDVGRIIDTITAGGSNQVNNIEFALSTSTQASLRTQALSDAAANAKSKAEALADGIDVKLGNILSLSESSYSYVPYARGFGIAEMAMAKDTQISPQELTITADVQVAYAIS